MRERERAQETHTYTTTKRGRARVEVVSGGDEAAGRAVETDHDFPSFLRFTFTGLNAFQKSAAVGIDRCGADSRPANRNTHWRVSSSVCQVRHGWHGFYMVSTGVLHNRSYGESSRRGERCDSRTIRAFAPRLVAHSAPLRGQVQLRGHSRKHT